MKNSIIAVEAPDEDMADDDYVDDQDEADEVLARHRRPVSAAAGSRPTHRPVLILEQLAHACIHKPWP